jgi:L-seryl-tRNA(Ser) seleniumtransferase
MIGGTGQRWKEPGMNISPAGSAAHASIYASLGVRTFINAAGTYTRLGGSRMPRVVADAMRAAADEFVEIDGLQAAVGTRIAALTHNEAAYVTCGAAAGLFLATAACMAGTDPALARQLPDPAGMPTRVVVYRAHRNPYDYAVRTLPVSLVEIGFPNTIAPPADWELAQALTEDTAAVLYVPAGWTAPGALPLAKVLEITHRRGVPVIVDAAAQLPPKENLWRFTQQGADLVIFSGGKDLCGPQASGLILGRPDLIAACVLIGAPHHGIGRPLKVGKEELVGLYAAVQWYMERDEKARACAAEAFVARLAAGLSRTGLTVERRFPNEAGQPVARALLRFEGVDAGVRCARAVSLLRSGDPSVEVGAGEEPASFYVNPMTVEPDEEETLLARLAAVLCAIA